MCQAAVGEGRGKGRSKQGICSMQGTARPKGVQGAWLQPALYRMLGCWGVSGLWGAAMAG